MTAVCVFQPPLAGALHLYRRIWDTDVCVLMDTAQFGPRSTGGVTGQGHMRLYGRNAVRWVGVKPVRRMQRFDRTYPTMATTNQVRVSVPYRYARWPFMEAAAAVVEPLRADRNLAESNTEMLRTALRMMGWRRDVVLASDLTATTSGKSAWVLELCRAVGADTYLSGGFGRDYLDMEAFADAGVAVEFQDWACPEYEQQPERPGSDFEPDLSIVDAFACLGPTGASDLLTSPAGTPRPSP